MKKQVTSSLSAVPSKDSYGNAVVPTMPYEGKKDQLQLTCTCPVDTSLTLIQSVFTHKNIYEKATTFAEADQNSQTCRLLQVFDLMKHKRWVEAKFLWIKNLPPYTKSEKMKRVNLFGSLSECFFEQFFHDSLDQNLLVTKSTVTTICDSEYCPKILPPANCFDIILM